MRHAMHSYALPLGTTLGKLLGQHLLPADSQSGICISSWKEMLINIPSQRQVCYNSVRGRVREREKKIVKRRGKNWKPHRTSQEPKTSGPFVDGRRKDYSAPRRTMQIDWKQGDILYSIFINNPSISQTRTDPSPRKLGQLNRTKQRNEGLAQSISPPLVDKAIAIAPHLAQNILEICSSSPVCFLPLFSTSFPIPMLHPWN